MSGYLSVATSVDFNLASFFCEKKSIETAETEIAICAPYSRDLQLGASRRFRQNIVK